MKEKLLITALIFHTIIIGSTNAQELEYAVNYFKPLDGIELKGHYQNSPDSTIEHFIKWEILLDGNMIRQLKTVPELDFKMEILLFFDQKNMNYAFHQLTNRGSYGSGTFRMDGRKLLIEGDMFTEGASYRRYKQSYEIFADGSLVDIFQRWEDGEWIIGHEILYAINSLGLSEIRNYNPELDVHFLNSNDGQTSGFMIGGNTGTSVKIQVYSVTGQLLSNQIFWMNNYSDNYISFDDLLLSDKKGIYIINFQTQSGDFASKSLLIYRSG